MWEIAFRMMKKHPLLGIGVDNFRLLHGSYLNDIGLWDSNHASHNLFVEILVSAGILGAMPFVIFIFMWFHSMLKRILNMNNVKNCQIALALFLSVLSVLIHGIVDYFLWRTVIYCMFWITLGASWRYILLTEPENKYDYRA